jgi:hypothetical protein
MAMILVSIQPVLMTRKEELNKPPESGRDLVKRNVMAVLATKKKQV